MRWPCVFLLFTILFHIKDSTAVESPAIICGGGENKVARRPATAERPSGWIADAFSRADDRMRLLVVAGPGPGPGSGGLVRGLKLAYPAMSDDTPIVQLR